MSKRKPKRRFDGRDRVHDPRDLDYLVEPPEVKRQRRVWNDAGWHGDQVDLPACCGFGAAGLVHCAPVRQWLDPVGLYYLAQHEDEWEGNDYDGTSVRGVMRVLSMLGAIEEYRWTWDADHCAAWVLERGPVLLGTSWYEGMDTPNGAGVMTLEGGNLGGHCYLAYGYNARTELFRIKNSYGEAWASGGYAYLRRADLQALLEEDDAEACVAIERKLQPN